MLNLTLSSCSVISIEDENETPNVHRICYCCVGMSNDCYLISNNRLVRCDLDSMSIICTMFLDFNDVIALHFSLLENSLMVIRSNGHIFLINGEFSESDLPELLGSFGINLVAATWSPDEELLVAVSNEMTVTILDSTYDVVSEIKLNDLPQAFERPQNVGWGKEETQFKGAGAKRVDRENTDDKKSEDVSRFETDISMPSVTWRDKSDVFAVSYLDPMSHSRIMSIFDREGTHMCSTAKDNDIQPRENVTPGHVVAFRPCGDLIATCGRNSVKAPVVNFFEKNCLKHGSFVVDSNVNASVYELFYNPTSELLFVLTETIEPEPTENDVANSYVKYEIRIYNRRNYHYYLTQSYTLTDKCMCYTTDPTRPYYVVIFLQNGCLVALEWKFESASFLHSNLDFFAVIDGDKLLCTPFGKVLVPPPMCFYQLQCSDPIVSRDLFGNFLFVWTQKDLYVYSCDTTEVENGVTNSHFVYGKTCVKYDKFPRFLKKFSLNCLLDGGMNKNLLPCDWTVLRKDLIGCYLHFNQLLFVELDFDLGVCTCKKKTLTDTKVILDIKSVSEVDSNVSLVLSCYNGLVAKYDENFNNILLDSFPKSCEVIRTVTINDILYLFGYSGNKYLYFGPTLISSEMTSFGFQNSNFLIFTTQSHRLFLVPLTELVENGVKNYQSWYSRKTERGSKIVAVSQTGTAVVLQMPRGNLECIHPKPLLVNLVEQYLDSDRYLEAFEVCQKHRLDMNILCDHDYQKFMSNINFVLQNVSSYLLVNLFISELTDKASEMGFRTNTPIPSTKVADVCGKLIESVEKNPSLMPTYYFSLIMCNVKLGNPKRALEVVKSNDKVDDPKSAGLDFLLLLVDVDKLFNLALSMYDKNLVLRVLEKSKKDPKEFLPLINNQLFKGNSDNEIRYNIDDYLQNHTQALSYLHKFCTDFDLMLKYIRVHSLFPKALSLFLPESSDQWKVIANEYGAILLQSNRYNEAGCLYAKMGCYSKAFTCFVKAKQYPLSVVYFHKLNPKTEPDYFAKREELVSGLESCGEYRCAAEIMSSYDEDTMLEMLIRNNCWSLCVDFGMKSKTNNLVGTVIGPSLKSQLNLLIGTLDTKITEVQLLSDRLKEIVVTKKQWILFEEQGVEGCGDATISEMSSVISKSSKRSSSSNFSSSSRKLNRKKRSLKKNSPEEHLAILEEFVKIHNFVKKTLESIQELSLVILSTPQLVINQSDLRKVSDSIDTYNSLMNRVWTDDEESLFNVKLNQFGENECNFDECVLKPMSNSDLKLFVKPDKLSISFIDLFQN